MFCRQVKTLAKASILHSAFDGHSQSVVRHSSGTMQLQLQPDVRRLAALACYLLLSKNVR